MYRRDQAGCSDHSSHQECSQISLSCDCNFCELDHWVSPPTWWRSKQSQVILEVWPGTACLSYNLSWYTCAYFPWLFTHTGRVGSGLTLCHTFLLSFDLMKTVNCGTFVRMWHSISNSEGWAHTMVLVLLCNSLEPCKGLGSASGGLSLSLLPCPLLAWG